MVSSLSLTFDATASVWSSVPKARTPCTSSAISASLIGKCGTTKDRSLRLPFVLSRGIVPRSAVCTSDSLTEPYSIETVMLEVGRTVKIPISPILPGL